MVANPNKSKCDKVIAACDQALADKQKEIDLAGDTLKKANDDRARLEVDNEALHDSAKSWYHNPIVMFVFGAAAGTLTYVLLKK